MYRNQRSSDRYPITARPDHVHKAWEFDVPDVYKERDDLWEIGDQLFNILVHPLPRPSSVEGDDWRQSLTVSQYDFFETWSEYLQTMTLYGTVIKSEFEHALDSAYGVDSRSWKGYGATIVTELPGTWNYPPVLLQTTICADGRVYSEIFNEDNRKEILGQDR